MHARKLGLAFLALLGANLTAQTGRFEGALDRSFSRWFRDYRAGRIEPGDARTTARKPYLNRALLASRPPVFGRYDRLREAEELFHLMKERGSKADGEHLVSVLAFGAGKKGGHPSDVGSTIWRFRRVLTRVLRGEGCPASIQAAVADRIRSGLVSGGEGALAGRHEEPAVAAILAPVLGSFGSPSFRVLLESCCKVPQAELQVAAAKGLARLGSGLSIAVVADILPALKYPERVGSVADSLAKLVEGKRPPPKERGLRLALTKVLDRLVAERDWRPRLALIEVVRRIRSAASIPFLLDLLDEAAGKAKKTQAWSGTLRSAVHAALVDLTGYYAGATQPEKWRAWWESEKERFVTAPPRKTASAKGGTVAQGFFGIPVTGNRVVFVLDVSGSMQWPYRSSATAPAGGTRAGGARRAGREFETRLDRARKELKKAVRGLPVDAGFNLILFESGVRTWRKTLVPATARNKKAIGAYLDSLTANGGTNLYGGLDRGLKIQVRRRPSSRYPTPVDEVFLLSDGSPTAGSIFDMQKILGLVAAWNVGARVRINTVFIGNEEVDRRFSGRFLPPPSQNMPPEEFMRRLATQNHGVFRRP